MNAWAKEPKPPRVTWLEPESDGDVPELLDEESPLKKLLRDDPPDEPWPPLDVDEPRGGHSALDGDAMPGWFGLQFSPGISA